MITAICPGSYDPVTNGHVDVIRRAASIFDRIVVGVVRDPTHKETLFTVEERVAFLENALAALDNVVVDVFSVLVVDFARKHDSKTMVKGLRVISDFEWVKKALFSRRDVEVRTVKPALQKTGVNAGTPPERYAKRLARRTVEPALTPNESEYAQALDETERPKWVGHRRENRPHRPQAKNTTGLKPA